MRNQMVNFLERNNMFNPDQHGFQKGKNCLTQLLHHIEDIICDLNLDKMLTCSTSTSAKPLIRLTTKILLKKIQAFALWYPCKIKVLQMTRSSTKIYLPISIASFSKKIFSRFVNWADANNMELNEEKFQLLQHGKLPDLKQPYILPSGETLKGSDHVKDLGVYIDPDLNWRTHIAMKSAKARNMASWVLRTFISRDVTTMMLLYKSYVRSHLEYCCPLWSPHMQCEIIKLEAVQRSFTAKIQGLGSLNYWERLRRLSMYSLQRRRERYTIILVWKIYNNLAPNSMNINFRETSRYGTTCIRPLWSSKYNSVNNLRFNSFASRASALYNVVPPSIKSLLTLTTFKPALDAFLNEFPDTPPTPGYTGQNRNSMLEWAGGTCL
ncbi:uncharacterized protein LOC134816990 [Bolinopsis microptera]|uniref:uncharacterized protein LOC134816990 n=1 Tax=Bolinopsis microptera TaxID=2820187 RepID=UPI0030799387